MPPPATLRLWGSCLGYLGIALALIWIAQLIWLQGGLMAGGSLLDTLAQVNPMLWLVIPLAGLPGFLIHLAAIRSRRSSGYINS